MERAAEGGDDAGRRAASTSAPGIWWALAFLCIGWAGVSASLLHFAPTRTEAAYLVWIGWGWGLTACAAAWAIRKQSLSLPLVLCVAILVRAPLVGSPPLLSDDLYRYLWEGLVLWEGGNPFTAAPAEVTGLDPQLRARVNHPEIPSIYPPISLLWFLGIRLTGGAAWTAQLWAVVADLATVGALFRLRRGAWPTVLYALHPLAALEAGSGAHLEAPAVALLAWGVALPRWGPFLATLGAGVKLFPGVLVPALAFRDGWKATVAGLGVAGAVIAVAALPVIQGGISVLTGLTTYATTWSFNGLLYVPLAALIGGEWARPLLMGAAALATLGSLWFFRRSVVQSWLAVGVVFVACSPTLHPWYGLWVLVPALLAGRPSFAVLGVSLLGGYGVLSGYDAATGSWSEPAWLWAVTWLPGLTAIAVEAVWRRTRR